MVTPAKRTHHSTHMSSPSSGLQLTEQAIDMPFAPGDLIAGKYEVIELIGSGGMGYSRHKPLDRKSVV